MSKVSNLDPDLSKRPNPYDILASVPTFELISTDLEEGGVLGVTHYSKRYGVPNGEDLSPHLLWKGAPAETKSFVVTCYDPDAPTVSGFWHWLVYDIPASVTEIEAGAGSDHLQIGLPSGAKALKHDAGFTGFLGAAPPPGHPAHRYIFCVWALGAETLGAIDATNHPTPSLFHSIVFRTGNVLARAYLTVHASRIE